jgi:hypothetical protein
MNFESKNGYLREKINGTTDVVKQLTFKISNDMHNHLTKTVLEKTSFSHEKLRETSQKEFLKKKYQQRT